MRRVACIDLRSSPNPWSTDTCRQRGQRGGEGMKPEEDEVNEESQSAGQLTHFPLRAPRASVDDFWNATLSSIDDFRIKIDHATKKDRFL